MMAGTLRNSGFEPLNHVKDMPRVHQGHGKVLIRFFAKPDDTTKPSRINRKRKKRWKIANLIPMGLSDCYRVALHAGTYWTDTQRLAMLSTAGLSSIGRRNLICTTGEKSPHSLAAFLCPPFSSAALCRVYSLMAGLFGQRSALAAPVGSFRPHSSPPPDSVETISGGYSSLQLELPA